MEKRQLGQSELYFTVVGYGTFPLGGKDWEFSWGPQDEKEAIYAMQHALDNGINWIDTAPVYGLGQSELLVGKAIQGRRDKIYIATKCGRVWDESRKIGRNLKKESILKEIEDSLKRLNTDYIDLYQIHWPQPEEEIEEAWETVHSLIQSGKIRYAGVSNFNIEQMKKISKIAPISSLQPPYSMLRRDIEKELLPYCRDNNIGVVVYSSLQKGLLTGKFTLDYLNSLDKTDHRKRTDGFFKEPVFSLVLKYVNRLKVIADEFSIPLLQLAILWILRKKEITSAIMGLRNKKHVDDIISLPESSVYDSMATEVEVILDEYQKELNNLRR